MEKILPLCTKYAYREGIMTLSSKKEQEIMAESVEICRKGLRGKRMDRFVDCKMQTAEQAAS